MAIELAQIVKTLQRERADVVKKLQTLDKAIASLHQLSRATPSSAAKGQVRRLSAAAREKIAKAQRVRWAKFKKEQRAKE